MDIERAVNRLRELKDPDIKQIYGLNVDPFSRCVISGADLIQLFDYGKSAFIGDGKIKDLVHFVNCIGNNKIGYDWEAARCTK